MAKKVQAVVKLQLPAGKATPAPPVGTALGPQGVNIMDFVKQFNAKTAKEPDGMIIPALVTIYSDRSFTFITKTPPASELLKRAAGIVKGSAEPNRNKVGKVTRKQVEEIAKTKLPDLNTTNLESAVRTVMGSARLQTRRGLGSHQKGALRQVRRNSRVGCEPGRGPEALGPDGARHRGAPARAGENQARAGDRHRRKSPRSAGCRRGFRRRRRHGAENSRRLDRFRRRHRHAGHDALRRTSR